MASRLCSSRELKKELEMLFILNHTPGMTVHF
jgi:hypothetical protein